MAQRNGHAQIDHDIREHFGFVPGFYDCLPDSALAQEWSVHRDFELGQTVIPNKYKELIGLAVAAHIKCRYCVYFHTEAARAFGASDEELKEAIFMGGLTVQFSNSLTGMRYDMDTFKSEVDRAIQYVVEHGPQPQPAPPTM